MFRNIPDMRMRNVGKQFFASASWRVCGIWVLGLVCLLAIVWQFTRMSLAEEKAVRTERGREKAVALAKAYARKLSRGLDQIERAAKALQGDWEAFHQPQLLERRLRRILRPSAGLH